MMCRHRGGEPPHGFGYTLIVNIISVTSTCSTSHLYLRKCSRTSCCSLVSADSLDRRRLHSSRRRSSFPSLTSTDSPDRLISTRNAQFDFFFIPLAVVNQLMGIALDVIARELESYSLPLAERLQH